MSHTRISRMTTETIVNPLGLGEPRPRFGWALESARAGTCQTAYRILVASSPSVLARDVGDVWDSGVVESPDSTAIVCDGPPLMSRERYYWKVRVWDERGEASDWSEPAWFETALMEDADWSAVWVGAPEPDEGVTPPAPMLRKTFRLDKPVASARAYVCGLGYFELAINGRPVSDEVLAPAFTPFHKRAEYVTYDVTERLIGGENAVGVTLGRGWMAVNTPSVWDQQHSVWRHEPCLLMQLEVEHSDGTRTTVITDETWKTHPGPTVKDSIQVGEDYDARLEIPGWDAAGFDDRPWSSVFSVDAPAQRLFARAHEPIRRTRIFTPVSVSSPRPGTWVFDTGTTTAGWIRLHAAGDAGTTIEIRYSEKLRGDGTVNNDNDLIYEEIQVDRYTLKGGGPETWEPRFSYKGFRYVQIDGYPGEPTLDTIDVVEVHSHVPGIGGWECSNDLLNTIHDLTKRSILNNLHGIPTDTPVYEKNGWTGDAHLTAEPALRNFGIERIHHKWLDDIADSQREDGLVPLIIPCPGWGMEDSPEWGSAYLMVAWYVYQATGDIRVLKRHYDGMRRYVDYLAGQAVDGISPSCLGDWLPPGYDGRDPEGPAISASAYVYCDARLLAGMARILQRPDDVLKYDELAARTRDAVNVRFLDAEAGVYSTDRPEVGYRQCPNILPLAFGMTPAEAVPAVVERLVLDIREKDNHLDCGILGTKWLLPVLTENGHADLAYRIATQRTYPSWGFWLEQGATALWEAWDLNSRSRDHHAFGTIDEWFYRYLAGIVIAEPGYRRIEFKPYFPSGLEWVKAHIETVRGRVACEWVRTGSGVDVVVTVPVNASATVHLAGRVSAPDGAEASGERGGRTVYDVGSGTHYFSVTL